VLDNYESHMRTYEKEKALGQWPDALRSIENAINACPVREALPTLTALREEAVEKAKPAPKWARLLGVRA
jgi:hypothetical protein